MTEQFTNDGSSPAQQSEPDVFDLIKKMQQQLDFLEKKIDILIKQSQEKSFREKYPPRSFRPSERTGRPYRSDYHHDKRESGEGSQERSFRPGRHSEKRQRDERRGFGGPKKDYGDNRENRSSQDRPFKKKYDDKKKVFSPRKKTFFHHRGDQ